MLQGSHVSHRGLRSSGMGCPQLSDDDNQQTRDKRPNYIWLGWCLKRGSLFLNCFQVFQVERRKRQRPTSGWTPASFLVGTGLGVSLVAALKAPHGFLCQRDCDWLTEWLRFSEWGTWWSIFNFSANKKTSWAKDSTLWDDGIGPKRSQCLYLRGR